MRYCADAFASIEQTIIPVTNTRERISVEQLVPGLFVDLGLSWKQHPFLRGRFKIKDIEQIEVIQGLGISHVTVDFAKSDADVKVKPAPLAKSTAPTPPAAASSAPGQPSDAGNAPAAAAPASDSLWQQKQASIDKAGAYRNRHADRRQEYARTARETRQLMKDLDSRPANAVASAGALVDQMTAAFGQDRDVIMNLITLQDADQDMYHHSLNVLVLSMLLGKVAGLGETELHDLGVGALMHDLGKVKVPSQIVMKTTPLSAAEQGVYQQHARFGRELVQMIADLPATALDIIHHHHEFLDGSGYPDRLQAGQIARAVRIVGLVNLYDNLCNPPNIADAMIPKTALSVMFTRYKGKLDPELLVQFIRTLGVYPPGTVVRLSDDSIGMVVSVDCKDLLKPEILLYNPEVPRKEALIVDLKTEDVSIEAALAPGQYPVEVLEYLGVRARAGYFFQKHS